MKNARIAVVEPSGTGTSLFPGYLRDNGFEVEAVVATRAAVRSLKPGSCDLLVGRSGPGEAETLRLTAIAAQRIGKPSLLVSAEGSDVERILFLKMGADDVVTPPYSLEEVSLRIRAVLRRSGGWRPASRSAWTLDGQRLVLDRDSHVVLLDGVRLPVTEAQWRILCFLAARGEAAVSREQLMEDCLEYTHDTYDRAVDTHIKNLRARLGNERWIETVRGYGYRFSWDAQQA